MADAVKESAIGGEGRGAKWAKKGDSLLRKKPKIAPFQFMLDNEQSFSLKATAKVLKVTLSRAIKDLFAGHKARRAEVLGESKNIWRNLVCLAA